MFRCFPFLLSENLATPPQTEEELIRQESMIAMRLFSPGFKKASEVTVIKPWICGECNLTNNVKNDDCDGCLAERPKYTVGSDRTAKNEEVTCDKLPFSHSWKCKECDWEVVGNKDDKCEMCCTLASPSHMKSVTTSDMHQQWTCKNCNSKSSAINEECTQCTTIGK